MGLDQVAIGKSFMDGAQAVLMELWYNFNAINNIQQVMVGMFY